MPYVRPSRRVIKYGKLTLADVLDLLRMRVYTVDIHTGTVTGPTGRICKALPNSKTGGRAGPPRYFVRVIAGGNRINIARAKLVWMAATLAIPPDGWEVHHDDEDCTNDVWSNLYCLHPLDHRKQHDRPRSVDDETPF